MGEDLVFHPNQNLSQKAHVKSLEQYHEMYKESVEEPEKFWSRIAERLHWYKKWNNVFSFDFVKAENVVPFFIPVQPFCNAAPEFFRLFDRFFVHFAVLFERFHMSFLR